MQTSINKREKIKKKKFFKVNKSKAISGLKELRHKSKCNKTTASFSILLVNFIVLSVFFFSFKEWILVVLVSHKNKKRFFGLKKRRYAFHQFHFFFSSSPPNKEKKESLFLSVTVYKCYRRANRHFLSELSRKSVFFSSSFFLSFFPSAFRESELL